MTKAFVFAGNETVGNMVADRLCGAGWQRVGDAGAADAVLTYFTTQTALEDAYFGDNGIVQGARKGTQIIDLSCTTPTFARELNAMACVADLVAVEAPLVVTDVAVPDAFAARENLGCFVGGEEDCVEAAREVLDLLVAHVTDAGGPGSAQLARAAYSLQATAQLVAAVEADALYHAVRTSSDMGEIAGMRAGAITPAGDALLAAVTDGRFDGTYTVEMIMGELTAALTTADDADLILPQAWRFWPSSAVRTRLPRRCRWSTARRTRARRRVWTGPAPSRRTATMITTMTMKPTGAMITAMPESWTTMA